MSAPRFAYLHARLLDPASGLDTPGSLLIEDGKIADFGAKLFHDGAPSVSKVIDCEGLCLAPGLIDSRVQLREPGEEHKETIETASRAAAAGGVTTIVALPNTSPVIDDVSVVEFMHRRANEAGAIKVRCYGSVTRGTKGEQLTEMGLLAEAGAVAFTDGTRAVSDTMVMRRALSYACGFNLIIVQHPEDPKLANGGAMNEGEIASRLGLSGIPPTAEVIMIERDVRLAQLTGGRYHAAHISTAGAVDVIRRAKAKGLNVTCDTAPHYFTLNETAIGDYRTFAKVSPPLRSEHDRRAIVEGLADGTIDIIASDHTPSDQDSKRLPFAQAEAGAVGLETLLTMTLEPYHNGDLGLLDALAKMTINPSRLFGLKAGELKRGAAADLVLFDPDIPWRIEEKNFHSKSKNTPFDGRPVQGRVMETIVDGRSIFRRAE
ncbi:MAG: dihydroorotase [Pseudomonadota bacterium]|nr:dihydroorotase [Pseudomonadota bacterium]